MLANQKSQFYTFTNISPVNGVTIITMMKNNGYFFCVNDDIHGNYNVYTYIMLTLMAIMMIILTILMTVTILLLITLMVVVMLMMKRR